MNTKKYLLIIGLFILLAGAVSAEGMCISTSPCGQCPGDTPSTITVTFEGVKHCGTNYPAVINDPAGREYTLYQVIDPVNFPGGCTYHYPLELTNDDEGIEIYLDKKGGQSEIRVLIDGGWYSQPADFSATDDSCEGEAVFAAVDNTNCDIGGGTAIVAPCTPAKVELKLAPKYIVATKKNRYFTPYPTPFDNYVCELIVDKDEAGAIDQLTKTAKLIDGEGNEINSGVLGPGKTSPEGDKVTYSWNITGWAEVNAPGIAKNNTGMEKLIENRNVKCEITIGSGKVESDLLPLSNCVHLWGSDGTAKDAGGQIIPVAKWTINNLRWNLGIAENDQSKLDEGADWIKEQRTSKDFITRAKTMYQEGTWKVAPFSEHKAAFSYYVDLGNSADQNIPILFGMTDLSMSGIISELSKTGCERAEKAIVHTSISGVDSTGAYGDPDSKDIGAGIAHAGAILLHEKAESMVIVHELAHTYRIDDEYVQSITRGRALWDHNCKDYPNRAFPAGFGEYGEAQNGCSSISKQRPSITSIMQKGVILNPWVPVKATVGVADTKFNLISCAYLEDGIMKNNNLQKSLLACKNMDVRKPAGLA